MTPREYNCIMGSQYTRTKIALNSKPANRLFNLLTCLCHSKQFKNEEMKTYFKSLYSNEMVAPSEDVIKSGPFYLLSIPVH